MGTNEDLSGADFREFDVFLSHRATDRDKRLAMLLGKKLDALGISYFLDTEDIPAGESFGPLLVEHIRCSRQVVVFFDDDISTWVHFEASCAFFDKKLLPVSVDDADVPLPYGRIQFERIYSNGSGSFDDDQIEELAAKIHRRLRGRKVGLTRLYRQLNRLFFSGLQILFVLFSAAVLIGLAPGTEYDHVQHLHVVLGAVIVGGQFFLAAGFARAVASPSFRERDYGFETTEKLFIVWLCFSLAQPVLGLWLVLSDAARFPLAPWVWLSLVLYTLALLFTVFGYLMAKNAMVLDRAHGPPRRIAGRHLAANVLFLIGFVLTVAVINVMIDKPDLSMQHSSTQILDQRANTRSS